MEGVVSKVVSNRDLLRYLWEAEDRRDHWHRLRGKDLEGVMSNRDLLRDLRDRENRRHQLEMEKWNALLRGSGGHAPSHPTIAPHCPSTSTPGPTGTPDVPGTVRSAAPTGLEGAVELVDRRNEEIEARMAGASFEEREYARAEPGEPAGVWTSPTELHASVPSRAATTGKSYDRSPSTCSGHTQCHDDASSVMSMGSLYRPGTTGSEGSQADEGVGEVNPLNETVESGEMQDVTDLTVIPPNDDSVEIRHHKVNVNANGTSKALTLHGTESTAGTPPRPSQTGRTIRTPRRRLDQATRIPCLHSVFSLQDPPTKRPSPPRQMVVLWGGKSRSSRGSPRGPAQVSASGRTGVSRPTQAMPPASVPGGTSEGRPTRTSPPPTVLGEIGESRPTQAPPAPAPALTRAQGDPRIGGHPQPGTGPDPPPDGSAGPKPGGAS